MLVFFINKFNDIDHMAPVIYRIAKDTGEKIQVLSINPLRDISGDFRLIFLRKKFNISIEYQYKYYAPNFYYKLLGALLCDGSSNLKESIGKFIKRDTDTVSKISFTKLLTIPFSKIFRYLLSKMKVDINKLIYKTYSKEWVKGLYDSLKPSALVFDHAAWPGLLNVGALLSVAREYSIPTIDLPHGIPLYVRHPDQWNRAKNNLTKYRKDYMVLHHRWWKEELIESGLDPNNTSILGSPRFCKDWEKILDTILPSDITLKDRGKDKLKVVYMELASRHGAQLDLNREAVERISKLDFVSLIVKPQTRSSIPLSYSNSKIYLAHDENSVNLIKWADVVIVLYSSIMLEVLIRDKVYLYPKYMHEKKMIYEEYGACWTVNSYDELENALKMLDKNRTYKPYSREGVDRYLTEIVYNGKKNRDVLGDYKNYILNISKSNGQNKK